MRVTNDEGLVMKSCWLWIGVVVLVMGLGVGLTAVRGQEARVAHNPEVIYEDEAARSSATITQVMPDSSKTLMTVDKVRRIRVQHDILVIEWGDTVTTLLPRQFVAAL